MLAPSYLLHATEPAEEIAEQLHQDILNRIIERILLRFQRGDDYILTSVDKWQLQTLQEAGFLLEDIQKEIANATGNMVDEIKQAMEDAGVRALEYDDTIYKAAGLDPVPLVQSHYLINLMQRDFEATLGEWKNFTRTTASAAQQEFISACDKAYHLAMSGAVSPSQAVKEAIEDLIEYGAYVRYDTGHTDTIETATARAVRTGISQASAHIQLARMDEMEVDLVLVSSHMGSRPTHQLWQGKIYSRSGDSKYPDFVTSTGYGTVTGLCGANCRHNFGPYFEGMDNPFEQYDSDENRKQYELEQRQRTLERRIRDTKRKTMNWKNAADKATDPAQKAEFTAEYERKAALLQKQNKAYNDFCESTGQKKRSERISIAKWDRSQAAQARAAARNAKNGKGSSAKAMAEKQKETPKLETAEQIQNFSSQNLRSSYNSHIDANNLRKARAEDIGELVGVDYSKLQTESARAFQSTFDELTSEYDTPLSRVRMMDKKDALFRKDSFAYTTHNYETDDAEIIINPLKCGDYEKYTGRIKELSQKGWSVKIPDKYADRYVATHEFAHTLANLEQPLVNSRNWVNADYGKIKSFRKEVKEVYDKYIADVGSLDSERKRLEAKIYFEGVYTQKDMDDLKEYSAILKSKKISNYSMSNADEFMAEAFTHAKLADSKNEYADSVLGIIDKYFKR